MNFVNIFGHALGMCTSTTCSMALKNLIKPTGVRFVDKIVVPTGEFCIAYVAGAKVAEVMTDEMSEMQKTITTIKDCRKIGASLNKTVDKMKEETKKMFEPELANRLNTLIDDYIDGKITREEYEAETNKIKVEEAKKAAAKTGKTPEEILKEAGLSPDILKEV